MKYLLTITASCLVLGACATLTDGQTEDITVRTPGAQNAKCFLQNDDFKYVAYTDETIEVMKSPHDIKVHCFAPGNRERRLLVRQKMHDVVEKNMWNGVVPGAAYDLASRGAYNYPREIVVNFQNQPVKPYGLPAHHAEDIHGNSDPRILENMGASLAVEPDGGVPAVSDLKKKRYYVNNSGTPQMDVPPVSGSSYDPSEEDK